MEQVKSLAGEARKDQLAYARQQEAVVSILRTANYLRTFCSPIFDLHNITPQQYNVLRILRGAGLEGLPTLEIAERMIEHAPGITRLLDRLEAKKLVRRERPSGNRRQVLCYVTKTGLDLVRELDGPMQEQAVEALRSFKKSEIDELIRLLERARNEH
jgi:DNA-binding MarR family transcriptional regulator